MEEVREIELERKGDSKMDQKETIKLDFIRNEAPIDPDLVLQVYGGRVDGFDVDVVLEVLEKQFVVRLLKGNQLHSGYSFSITDIVDRAIELTKSSSSNIKGNELTDQKGSLDLDEDDDDDNEDESIDEEASDIIAKLRAHTELGELTSRIASMNLHDPKYFLDMLWISLMGGDSLTIFAHKLLGDEVH